MSENYNLPNIDSKTFNDVLEELKRIIYSREIDYYVPEKNKTNMRDLINYLVDNKTTFIKSDKEVEDSHKITVPSLFSGYLETIITSFIKIHAEKSKYWTQKQVHDIDLLEPVLEILNSYKRIDTILKSEEPNVRCVNLQMFIQEVTRQLNALKFLEPKFKALTTIEGIQEVYKEEIALMNAELKESESSTSKNIDDFESEEL